MNKKDNPEAINDKQKVSPRLEISATAPISLTHPTAYSTSLYSYT